MSAPRSGCYGAPPGYVSRRPSEQRTVCFVDALEQLLRDKLSAPNPIDQGEHRIKPYAARPTTAAIAAGQLVRCRMQESDPVTLAGKSLVVTFALFEDFSLSPEARCLVIQAAA